MSRYRARYQDPQGKRHQGFPTYGWRCVPQGLATRRQLSQLGLRPAGQQPVAQLLWARGRGRRPGFAYLYDVALAAPKRQMDAGRWRTHQAMMRARRTCRNCSAVFAFDLSRKFDRTCLDCLELAGVAA
jgi:hypothetical protein